MRKAVSDSRGDKSRVQVLERGLSKESPLLTENSLKSEGERERYVRSSCEDVKIWNRIQRVFLEQIL